MSTSVSEAMVLSTAHAGAYIRTKDCELLGRSNGSPLGIRHLSIHAILVFRPGDGTPPSQTCPLWSVLLSLLTALQGFWCH